MRPSAVRSLAFIALAGAACATAQSGMHRALDPSMERALRTEAYLRSVSGITGTASRLMRGDGYVYLSDVAPQLQYLADSRDTTRYRLLRTFVQEKMLRRDSSGMTPGRRYRADQPLAKATPYGFHWLGEALADGWRLVGDTVSAELLGQVNWSLEDQTGSFEPTYQLSMRCADAQDAALQDPAPGYAVLKTADKQLKALGVRGKPEELDVMSCLTRLALAVHDPDATVRYLDRMLDILEPLLVHSGRPDAGTSADVLMTLRQVREAGPKYFNP